MIDSYLEQTQTPAVVVLSPAQGGFQLAPGAIGLHTHAQSESAYEVHPAVGHDPVEQLHPMAPTRALQRALAAGQRQ